MWPIRLLFFLVSASLFSADYCNLREFKNEAVIASRPLQVKGTVVAFNPTMIRLNKKSILVAFRHQFSLEKPWLSEICLVLLDNDFKPISKMQRLNIRLLSPTIPSRAEDPRMIRFNGKIYLFYNDNLEKTKKPPGPRRDMYCVEVIPTKKGFKAGKPLLLKHPTNYPSRLMEKNWTPFVYQGKLLLSYFLNPHEVLIPNLNTGKCDLFSKSEKCSISYEWGGLRGGTPAVSLGDRYLAFFHSFVEIHSNVSRKEATPHYFFGAYTFSKEPPFELMGLSPHPIVAEGFYPQSDFHKRVIYPSGLLVEDEVIHLSCGKNDSEMLIITLDKQKLLEQISN